VSRLDDQLKTGDGLSPETEEVLRRARRGAPMPQLRKRRLKGALLARLAVASTATLAAGQATGAAMGLGLAAKVVVGLAVVGSIGAGVTLAVRPSRPHVERPSYVAVAHAAVAPVVAPARSEVMAPPAEAPVVEPPAVRAEPRAHARHAVVHHAAPPANTLAEETSLLRDADKALRAGDTATALARLDEDAARFPHGALAPERTAERLLVLCEVGAADPKAVAQFLASHPGSPLAARVRRACAPKP
jgi:hypothetical protein